MYLGEGRKNNHEKALRCYFGHCVLSLFVAIIPAFAAPAPSDHTNFGSTLNASTCNTSGSPVVNITFKVTNDFDSGVAGNAWANDNYNKHVQVWQQSDGSFCAIAKYQGQLLPLPDQVLKIQETVGAGVKGTFEGGYQATFNGTLNRNLPTKGNIGSFDYQCNGTFTCPGSYDWAGAYFGSTADGYIQSTLLGHGITTQAIMEVG